MVRSAAAGRASRTRKSGLPDLRINNADLGQARDQWPRGQAAPHRPPSSFETFVVAARRRTLRMRAGLNVGSETPIGRPPMPRSFRQVINAAVADKRFLVVPGAHAAL